MTCIGELESTTHAMLRHPPYLWNYQQSIQLLVGSYNPWPYPNLIISSKQLELWLIKEFYILAVLKVLIEDVTNTAKKLCLVSWSSYPMEAHKMLN